MAATPPPSDDALAQSARLEQAIARIAACLAMPDELDLTSVLGDLGRAVDVDRTYVFRFRGDGTTCDNTHEWCADGVAPQRPLLQGVDTSPLAWWMGRMRVGRPVVIPDLSALPPEAEAERALLGAQGIQSLLAVPVTSGAQGLLGFVGFDDVRRPRAWREADVRALRVVGDLLATELDRRAAAEALRASERHRQLVLDATTDGFWDWDVATDVVVFSDRWFTMLDVSPTAAPTRVTEWVARLHPDDVPRFTAGFRAHARGVTAVWQTEGRIRDGHGAWRWILTRGRIVARDEAGRPLRVVGTHTDVSERRLLEDQLRQAQKMEAVGQLTAGIAHDFNNLLTVMVGHAALLLEQLPADGASHPHALAIRRAAERASQLTAQLLAFGRKHAPAPQELDVGAVVGETQRMLDRLIDARIALTAARPVGEAVVRADPVQLQQVLLNLVMNARDAMPAGGQVRITVGAAVLDAPIGSPAGVVPAGDWVTLEVADTGAGVPAGLLSRILEPFFTTKADGKGSGLGLPTVLGIVRQAEGHLWLDSVPGSGTTVRVYLPRAVRSRAGAAITPAGGLPAEGTTARGTGTVLLVEDDPTVRQIVEAVLRRAGLAVSSAATPHEALARADGLAAVDLLLTDLRLPGIDGLELAARLRARRPTLPVLVMSASAERDRVEREILDAGHAFLAKPFTPRRLSDTVVGLLGRQNSPTNPISGSSR